MARLYVVYGVKYEPQWLVDDMKENLSYAYAFAEVDCRGRTNEFWIHEGEYRKLQRKALLEAGISPGDWVLVTSPDERWEDRGRRFFPELMQNNDRKIFRFPLKEMFSPTQYRIDGFWGRKTRPRMYQFWPRQEFAYRRLQSIPVPIKPIYRRELIVNINLYHLKNIEESSRKNRALAYERCDPDYKLQKKGGRGFKLVDQEGVFERQGYHYLYDMEGVVLREIPKGREFSPAYTRPYYFDPEGF